MSGTWAASMRVALAATMARPTWWLLALAAFLVRGGFVLVILPLVSLPSAASVATALAPPIEALVLSRQSAEAALVATAVVCVVVALLVAAGLAGSWLDVALLREASADDELDLRRRLAQPSAWLAFAMRLTAHLPTMLALGYATVRIVIVTYAELLSPGDPSVPVAARVVARAPDAIGVVVLTWLLGEAVGGLAFRRAAAGEAPMAALRGGLRDLLERRGLATFAVTDGTVLLVVVALVAVVGRASEHVRAYLFDRVDAVNLAAALLLLVSAWILGLATLGAALAWRATAWTAVAGARHLAADRASVPQPGEAPIA